MKIRLSELRFLIKNEVKKLQEQQNTSWLDFKNFNAKDSTSANGFVQFIKRVGGDVNYFWFFLRPNGLWTAKYSQNETYYDQTPTKEWVESRRAAKRAPAALTTDD